MHSVCEFDIIPSALQMFSRVAVSLQRSIFGALLQHVMAAVLVGWLLMFPHAARAQNAPAEPDHEPGTSRKEVLSSLQEIQRKYGSDAVMMEGQLLGEAIRGGSIVDAAISISGYEERGGKRFLAFQLETGIIYNDRDVSAPARPLRLWAEVIEISLRKFPKLTLPAEGVAVLTSYAHKPYESEADLRRHLHEDRGQAETVAFYFLVSDIGELVANRITSQQLIDRATILVNGTPTRLVIDPAPTPQ